VKVKEVIEKLKNFDPEEKVIVFNGEFCNEVEKMELINCDDLNGEFYENDKGKTKAIQIG
jgi:hypothetical protein